MTKRFKSTKPIDCLFRSAAGAVAYEEAASSSSRAESNPEQMGKKWAAGMARHFRRRFARQLRSLRERAGLSLHGLADKAGVDHSQLARLESGHRSCTLETAVKIAAALGVSLGLLTDEK